eukprot:451121_1
MTTRFIVYSVALFMFTSASMLLIIMQILSDRSSRISDRHTKVLLYAVYISAFGCGAIGFSLHLSSNHIYCEFVGLTPCFILLGGSKAIVYLFFLHRAKMAQGIIVNKCSKIFFKFIGPSYLLIYVILYSLLTKVVYSGAYVHNINDNNVSHCVFDKWVLWFPLFAACVDVLNSISSVVLFSYPLLRAMNDIKTVFRIGEHKSTNNMVKKLGFVKAMKWNVFLTTIASFSSITALFMIAVVDQYIWLFCIGDPAINATCVFFMIATNRTFIADICGQNRSNTKKQKKSN